MKHVDQVLDYLSGDLGIHFYHIIFFFSFRDNSGWSPLHYAAFEGHGAACAALLAAGASVDACDNEGKSPLMLACQEGHVSVAELLMQSGAPVEQRAHDGNTALRLAAMEGHEVRKLFQLGFK